MANALIFGSAGQIGGQIAQTFGERDWNVTATARATRTDPAPGGGVWALYDPFAEGAAGVLPDGPFDAVVWAQGANVNDSVASFDDDAHLELLKANYLYVAKSMRDLVAGGRLAPRARLCVISSIWQTAARQNKFSYMVSKAALQGLVLSAATDLAVEGYLVNAVLPGVLDTPMTRSVLAPDQLNKISQSTLFGRLPALNDVAEAAFFLCAPTNTSITGQFLSVDLGYQNVRIV